MKRLSKITESIWSDIQDRSMGKTVRREDDVNLMSEEDFCDYLNDNYICKDGYRTYKIYYVSKVLHITVLKKFINVSYYSIKYDYKTNMIYLNDDIEDFVPELCQKLKNNFKVVKKRVGDSYIKFIIYPPDGSECTNRFFVDVINFIIENRDENVLLFKKKHINESIWSDIQDRSVGKTRRREDDVDLLDETGLVNYMKKIYMPPSPNDDLQIIGGGVNSGTIIASLFKTNEGHYNIIYQKMSESNPEITFPVCPDSGIEDLLKEHYTVISIPRYNNKIYYIKPKDGSKITNKFFLEIIDFILDAIKDDDNIYQVIFKKKHINESIWSDIQDRSMGKTRRREDDVNIFDCDELYDYIFDLYKSIDIYPLPLVSSTSQTHTYFSIPIFKSGYKVYRIDCTFENNKISKIRLMATDADVKDFKQSLIDNFDVTIDIDGALTITAKDGTVSNKVCMDLIKTIIENAPHPYLKKREN